MPHVLRMGLCMASSAKAECHEIASSHVPSKCSLYNCTAAYHVTSLCHHLNVYTYYQCLLKSLFPPCPRSFSAKAAATSRLLMAIRASNSTFPVARWDSFCFHLKRTPRADVPSSFCSPNLFLISSGRPSLSASRMQCFSFTR